MAVAFPFAQKVEYLQQPECTALYQTNKQTPVWHGLGLVVDYETGNTKTMVWQGTIYH